MNITDSIILGNIIKPKIEDVPDDFKPYGIPIGGSSECEVLLWLNYNKPSFYNGVEMFYPKFNMESEGDYITQMGFKIEDVMENHMKLASQRNKGFQLIGSQMKVRDLNNKWRGNLDFAVNIKSLGVVILDAKGMSEKVFSRFTSGISLKEFKLAYYTQVVSYMHIMKADLGAIVGVNRSSGKVHVSSVTRADTKKDFDFTRNKVWRVLKAKTAKELNKKSKEECGDCPYFEGCWGEPFNKS